MKREKISDSLTDIRTEYIEEAAAYTAENKVSPRVYGVRWIAVAACFCIVALLGVGVWQSEQLHNDSDILLQNPGETSSIADNLSSGEDVNDPSLGVSESNPTSDDADTELVASGNIKGGQTTPSASQPDIQTGTVTNNAETDSLMLTKWKGLTCTLGLYITLTDEAKQDTLLSIGVGNHSDEALNSFVYKGETYPMLLAEREQIREQNGKLGGLLKEGAELCYGEVLYTTGGPNGYKWARELYEERIAYYGEEFLAKYLGDRVVYTDLIEADIAKGKADYDAVCRKIDAFFDAFFSAYTEETRKFFADMDIPVVIAGSQCRILITPRQLAAIAEKEGMDVHYFFSHVIDAEAEDQIWKFETTTD